MPQEAVQERQPIVRLIWIFMLASLVMFAVLGEILIAFAPEVPGAFTRPPGAAAGIGDTLRYVFYAVALGAAVASRVAPRRLFTAAAAVTEPTQRAMKWQLGNVAAFALCEAVGV